MSRILMVTQPSDGGVFEHLSRLCRGLTGLGHEIVVAGPVAERARQLEARVEPMRLVRSVTPRADAAALTALGRLVRRVRPDLIHAHSSKAGAVARLARVWNPRTPVVYTPHGYAFAGYFESEHQRSVYRAMERALAPLTTMVLCVCEAERRLAESVGNAGRTRVVHNGVEPHSPAAPDPGLADTLGGPVIGVLSLLRPGKGVETMIEAMPRLARAHPGVQLAIAGDGPQRASLEALAAELGVSGWVCFLGETPGPGRLLDGIDLFVNPSWAESFPYSSLEAMAAGLPVVATDVGGTREAVADGISGYLVAPRDPRALAEAIAVVLSRPDRGAGLGEAGRRRIEQQFTVSHMAAGTAAVYAELLGG
jgi:glycosyltransferase involved in cell wall biosynthesis